MLSRGMCAGNAVFYHTEVVFESKMVREMLCFTIETAVGGCAGRRCETAGAAMVAYACLCLPMVAYARLTSDRCSGNEIVGCESHCSGGFQVVLAWRWWRIRECHCRFPWWRGVIGESHCRWRKAL